MRTFKGSCRKRQEPTVSLANPSTTYQHMRPRLREESVNVYSRITPDALWRCNSGGIFLISYRYRISAPAALCDFPTISTGSIIVFFLQICNFLYYINVLMNCQGDFLLYFVILLLISQINVALHSVSSIISSSVLPFLTILITTPLIASTRPSALPSARPSILPSSINSFNA